MRCVRCVNESRKKRKRLRWQAANHGCHCFDRAFLLAGACVCCVKFLAVFVYATHATQAIAFEWKPGLIFAGTAPSFATDNAPECSFSRVKILLVAKSSLHWLVVIPPWASSSVFNEVANIVVGPLRGDIGVSKFFYNVGCTSWGCCTADFNTVEKCSKSRKFLRGDYHRSPLYIRLYYQHYIFTKNY